MAIAPERGAMGGTSVGRPISVDPPRLSGQLDRRPERYTSLVPFDTSPEALRAQTEAQRRLGGAERFLTACRMSQAVRELALARIRSRQSEPDERQALEQLMAELYGFRRNP